MKNILQIGDAVVEAIRKGMNLGSFLLVPGDRPASRLLGSFRDILKFEFDALSC